ncbi:MAG: TolC family protein [Candidatus Goldbacteria bacterium]|nr:TolC family protein [Candidatus Goldiibacteriota bacterium]
MKRSIFVFLTIIIFIFNLYADEKTGDVLELDFDACYELAEKQNPDYIKAKYKLVEAEADFQKAVGSFGPTLSLMTGYQPIYKATMVEIPAGVLGPTALSFPMGSQTYYSMRLSVTQPVFTFGKLFFGYRMATSGYRIAKIQFKKAEEKLKLDTISSFYGALIASELYKITDEAAKRTEEMLEITRKKYKIGEASKLDLLMAEVELANTKPKIIDAKNNLNMAIDGLKMTLGLDLKQEITLKGTPNLEKYDISYEDAKKMIGKYNDDYEMMKSVADLYNSNFAWSMLLPDVALSGNLNYLSYEKDFSTSASNWNKSWDVTIGLRWSFFNSYRVIADVKKAIAEDKVQHINLEQTRNGLEVKLKSLYATLDANKQIIEAADKTIKQAEEGYKMAKESYKEGIIKRDDLVGAELVLMQAKMQYLNALYKYTTNLQELKNFIE